MGGITSGVGLATGIDTQTLINQLIAIESRPRLLAEQRVLELQQQQAAWLGINSAIGGLNSTSSAFRSQSLFQQFNATSSNEDALTASARTGAAPGTYTFNVERLVSSQQQLSRGFSDVDTNGIGATSFTFEDARATLARNARITELNGGDGIDRGVIRITDKSGATAEIDLSRIVEISDVLDAINSNADIGIRASANNGRLELVDLTGGAGDIIVEDGFGDTTATDLGIEGRTGAASLLGSDIYTISGSTALSVLNDDLGVYFDDSSADFTITARDDTEVSVNLGRITKIQEIDGEDTEVVLQNRATTIQDVIDIINAAADEEGVDVRAGIAGDGRSLVITDNTGGPDPLSIVSADGRSTAEDLGIATGPAGVASSMIEGETLLGGMTTVLARNLDGGLGLGNGKFNVTDRAGNALNYTISQDARDGTLTDVMNEINDALATAGVAVTLELNSLGNGLKATDASGGSSPLIIGGQSARALGLDTTGTLSNTYEGASAQLQWISRATDLEDLNQGEGLGRGTFSITDASGAQTEITLSSTLRNVGELLDFLNSRPNISIDATLNATGDGILIQDTSGGGGDLIIEDVSGDVMANLNLEGTFESVLGVTAADGTYERTVEVLETDTLEDIVDAINLSGVPVDASILDDGSPGSPFRLSLTSRTEGERGRMIMSAAGLDLGLSTLSQGDDAVVFYGAGNPADGVLLTSSTNTFRSVARGLDVTLTGTSPDPVEVTVSPDTDRITEGIDAFVEAFNATIRAIDQQATFNVESETGGPLVGDATARFVRRDLLNAIQDPVEGFDNRYRFLFEVGIRISGSSGGNGNAIEFDRERFEEAYARDPDAVERLFSAFEQDPRTDIELAPGITVRNTGPTTFSELGVLEQIAQLADRLTDSIDGTITRRTDTIDESIRLQNQRIEQFNAQLDRKRAQLEQEFANLELVVAGIQNQQQSLATIAPISL